MKLSELIAKLEEAEEGSRDLDLAIQKYLDIAPATLPAFTTSLDAKLPWENIVATDTLEDGRHAAWHGKGINTLSEGVARTEPLARRVAALKAKEAE